LAGLSADAAELERRLRLELELEAAAALRVDMAGLRGETRWFLRTAL
jgi:hypothetical protein